MYSPHLTVRLLWLIQGWWSTRANSDPVVAILRQAREYLYRGWCQQYGAAMRIGPICIEVETDSGLANCFCALGALRRASHKHNITADTEEYRVVLGYLDKAIGRVAPTQFLGESIIHWNDDREQTQAEVLRVFDNAITSAVLDAAIRGAA